MGKQYLHGLSIGLLLLLVGCQSGQPGASPTASPETGLRESAMIFTAEQAEQMQIALWLQAELPIEGFWTPEPAHVQALEADLPAFLAENAERFRRTPPPWESLDDYNVQYLGTIEGGEQLIYANFFCKGSPFGEQWRVSLVEVEDGGDCYFQLRYRPKDRTFHHLQVNGEA